MRMKLGYLSTALLAGLVLSGCATQSVLPPPKAEAFNFEQVAKDSGADAQKNLVVDVRGEGVKNKKVVIGAFEVRFRADLGAYAWLDNPNSRGTVRDFNLLSDNSTLFQNVTNDLYKQFVADLKQRGYTVLPSNTLKFPAYSKGLAPTLKETFRSGRYAKLEGNPILMTVYDDDPTRSGDWPYGSTGKEIYDQTAVGKFFTDVGDMLAPDRLHQPTPYYIYYPNEVPGLNVVFSLLGSGEHRMEMMNVNPGNKGELNPVLPQPFILEAAAKTGADLVTVVFEVELMKFHAKTGDCGGFMGGKCIFMNKAPMVRTRLHSLQVLPVGVKSGMFSWADNGLFITSKHRGLPHKAWILHAMLDGKDDVYGYNWAEVDDGSVQSSNNQDVVPVSEKFPAAFKKSTGAHLNMVMHVLDHQNDYK